MSSHFTSPRQRQVNEPTSTFSVQRHSLRGSTLEPGGPRKQKSRMVSFRVDEDDFVRLDALAHQTSCSRAEVLRRCLRRRRASVASSASLGCANDSGTSKRRPRVSWKRAGAGLTGIRLSRPRCRRACGMTTRSHSTKPVCSANTPGTATGTPPPASVDDSRRSIATSDASSPPYPSRAATESAFHNSSRSAKPSNLGPSGASSPINGRRFGSPRTLARGDISSPAAPHTATPVRFDFCLDESRNEATGI